MIFTARVALRMARRSRLEMVPFDAGAALAIRVAFLTFRRYAGCSVELWSDLMPRVSLLFFATAPSSNGLPVTRAYGGHSKFQPAMRRKRRQSRADATTCTYTGCYLGFHAT